MIDAWWAAHELEVVTWAIVIGLAAVLWLVVSLGEAWEERKRKKRDGLL